MSGSEKEIDKTRGQKKATPIIIGVAYKMDPRFHGDDSFIYIPIPQPSRRPQ
jgi:hypothetical protein